MISSPLCELLGIKYPVIQGGMAWIANAHLAASVSNAGGLGLIAAMNSNGEQLREQIKKAKEMTDKIFGVNLMLMSPFIEEAVEVVCEEGIKVVTTGAGNPSQYMDKLKAAGVKVIPVVPSVSLAKRMESLGATAVIAEGGESGGHVGETTTMALVPGCRCSKHSCYCSRWNCRRKRNGSSIYAWCLWCSDGNCISCCR